MCDKVQTALDMVKERKSLTKGEVIMVFQKVAEDLRAQGERMTNLEKELSAFKEETRHGFDEVNSRLYELIELVKYNKKGSFWDKIPLLKDIPNLAWFLLIIVVCIIGSILGANLDFLTNALHIGG